MRLVGLVVVGLAVSICPIVWSQAPNNANPATPPAFSPTPLQIPATPTDPPNYANYSLMLVSPVLNGGAVVLMHDTKNQLELVPVSSTKQASDMGFVAVRASELDELIGALREENARLSAEVERLSSSQPPQLPTTQTIVVGPQGPSDAEIAERRREAMAAEQEARRQQLIQAWMGLQRTNRPYQLPMPVNPNANRLRTNCVTTQLGITSTTNCN